MKSTKPSKRAVPYLVVIPYQNSSTRTHRTLRFQLSGSEFLMGSGAHCDIVLTALEEKHARIYLGKKVWYFQDLTQRLLVRHQGILVRWFPLEFDSQTFVVGPWLCCFFTGVPSEANSYDQQLKAAAETDGLTHLPLRVPFDNQLENELKHAEKTTNPLSVLHIDLDHFHALNETYKHTGGDAVLRDVAQRMRSHTRGREMVARYGGEEFVALLPDTNEKQALEVAERLRRAIAETPVSFGAHLISVTASIGCATTYQPTDPILLIAQADRAMYRAKTLGRNCVCLYDASADGVVTPEMVAAIQNKHDESTDEQQGNP